jgi:hypothetical protein
VFFTFMPIGAIVCGLGGALLFGVLTGRAATPKSPSHGSRLAGPTVDRSAGF